MPAMSPWWRSSGCRWRGWSIAAANSSGGGAGQASGPSRATASSSSTASRRQQLRPGPLLRPVLAQAQLAAVLEPDQHPRGAVFERGALVVPAQAPGRHQVDQQGEVAELDHRQLADPPHRGQLAAGQRLERRVEGLHHVHPGRQRRFHRRAGQRRVEAAHGDLYLGELGHGLQSWRVAGVRGGIDSVQFIRLVRGGNPAGSANIGNEEGSMQELPTIQPTMAPDLSPEEIGAIQDEVRALAAERNAVILAHNYQLPEVQDVADYMGDSARPLAPGGGRRRRRDRLLRRPLHGRDRLDPLARQEGADPRPRRRLLARRLDRRRPAARLEGRAPRRRRRHVRQHLGRGQGGDRLLLHLLQRGPGRRAHLGRARPRDRDPLRPRHVAGRLRRARDRAARGPRAPRPLPRLGRRVPRPRRHPPRGHRADPRRAPRGRVPDPPRVRLLDPGDGVRRRRRQSRRAASTCSPPRGC